jgi:hypothetical protein
MTMIFRAHGALIFGIVERSLFAVMLWPRE